MRVFISFNSKDAAIAEIVKSKLESLQPKMEIYFSPVSLTPGFWLPKLAQWIGTAEAFLLLLGPKGVGPWQEIEYHEAFDRHVRDPRFTLVPLVLGSAQVPGLPFLRQLNWVTVEDAREDRAAHRILAALEGETGPPVAALWTLVQPYRGLEAMTEASADYFYGRGVETTAVLDLLRTKPDRLSLLIGASGVGKSSIARAGVFSALKAMRWPSVAHDGKSDHPWPTAFRESRNSWAFLEVRPGAEPLHALAGAFVRLWHADKTDPDRAALIGRWAEGLRTGANRLKDLLDVTQEVLEKRDDVAPSRMLIYIDQAEELYTRAPGGAETESAQFSEALAAALPDPRLLAFGSLRADYFDRLQADAPLFGCYEHVDVPPMRPDQLAEVVARPAETLGVTFEDERLCGRIVQAAASEPGQLPLLAYLLTDMWSAMVSRRDGCLRLAAEAIDIGGVLAARAEQFLRDNPGEEACAKRLFTLRLALVSPEGLVARRSASRAECDPREWSLVERLADYPWRLVVARERDSARGEPVAELAHEALLKAWPRLEAWLRGEREFLVSKAEVERAERRWRDRGQAEAALLVGLDLAGAESWLQQRGLDLPEPVRGFIQKSVSADRRRKERALRFQRRVSAGFALAALVLLGIGGLAYREKVAAKQNARRIAFERDRADRTLSDISFLVSHGNAKEKNNEGARTSLEKEAQDGYPGAMSILGLLYGNGWGVLKDYAKAKDWYEKAARAGSADGMNNMGDLYCNGQGVPQDYPKAKELYEKAAAAGSANAMNSIGWLYQNGWGVPQDNAKAKN